MSGLPARELNFDGLVGPTHHYAGLSPGNLASLGHAGEVSNPRSAALEGLRKMQFVAALGVGQAVLPPAPRPDLRALRRLGFSGPDTAVLAEARRRAPELLSAVSSASSMWAANAATVVPSSDASDGRVHFVPANLVSMLHRSLEAEPTTRALRAIFADPARFAVHAALPASDPLADEGAANHCRVSTRRAAAHLFAWGRSRHASELPVRYPARQTREASEAIARLSQIAPESALFWQQAPAAIDAGAFHLDVLAASNESFLMLHECAFVDALGLLAALRRRLGDELSVCVAGDDELPMADAVSAYPFNSQLVTLPGGGMAILAPRESEASPSARRFLDRVVDEANPIRALHYLDLNGSMRNGGGPACLRLRVLLTPDEEQALAPRVRFDEALATELSAVVTKRYRDRVTLDDLADPQFIDESHTALDEITRLLGLGSIYDFQSDGTQAH